MRASTIFPTRRSHTPLYLLLLTALFLVGLLLADRALAVDGVNKERVLVASVLDLKGRSRGLGQGMKKGLEAAFADQQVHGRRVELITMDDSYTPSKTIAATKEMLRRRPFVMIGNVGTPTAKVSLPLLAEARVPAVGFFTGAGLLRPGVGDIINYRASYVQETAAVIARALDNGVKPDQVCAYVQNDAYGMAGVAGVIRALDGLPGAADAVTALRTALAMEGENPARNGVAPLGVYQRNTFTARDGYDSLKAWEEKHGSQCRLVVTVGAYTSIANFIGYSRYKGENWVATAVSFTGADNFQNALAELNATDRVIMTQVVPLFDSTLPIVQEARARLGDDFGYVSLEGFIVGRMFLHILDEAGENPTRQSFLDAVEGQRIYLDGMVLDFSDDNQGSDLVITTHIGADTWQPVDNTTWRRWLR